MTREGQGYPCLWHDMMMMMIMPNVESLSTMPNVASLSNKSNIKKLRNNQRTEPHKCNCTNKSNCPLKEKCHFVCMVYKVEVHSRESIGPKLGITPKTATDLTIVMSVEMFLKKYT